MKEIVTFTLFPGPSFCGASLDLSPSDFVAVVNRWPQFKKPNLRGFNVKAEKDSSELAEIFQFLKGIGKVPYMKCYPSPNREDRSRFPVEGRREFDKSDLNAASFLISSPHPLIANSGRHEGDGTLSVPRSKILRQPIGRVLGASLPVCTDTLRHELDTQNFSALTYRPVKVEGKLAPLDPLWELWSETRLPLVLNRLTDESGEDFDPAKSTGCTVDDLYFPWMLRYKKNEIAALGDFDAALTREHFGHGVPQSRDPFLIVSQRFRKWCDARKLKINWWPVALE